MSGAAIPAEFSKNKDEINDKLEKGAEDSGEALMMAMACRAPELAGQKKHSCSIIDLIQKEFGVDVGIKLNGAETEDELKAKESEAIAKYMEMGLSESSERVRNGVGTNCLTPPPKEHPCWTFFKHQIGIFSLLLWAGSFLCFIAYAMDQVRGSVSKDNLYLGCVLAAVVFLTGVFEYLQEAESAKTMEGFADMLPKQANVVRDGKAKTIPALDLVVGDVMTVNMGDQVPADLRMLSVTNLKVEQSSLTGEPDAIAKSVNSFEENPLESKNIAFFGTSAEAGNCTAAVVLTGDDTIMGNIASLAAGGDTPETPIHKEIHRFIVIVSGIAVLLGVTFGIICIASGQEPIVTLVFVIGIIVANVPEGLLATVTVSLTLTAVRLGKKNVNVKDLEGVETLGSTTCICSDKTGTLTQNRMTSNHIYLDFANPTDPDGTYQVNAITSSELGDATPGFDFGDVALNKMLMCCNLVNACVFDTGKVGTGVDNLSLYIQARECLNGNASDIAFFKFAEGCLWKRDGITLNSQPKIPAAEDMRAKNPVATTTNETGGTAKLIIPFNSKYKFMVSVNWVADPTQGGKLRPAVLMKGAAEQIFQRCANVVKGDQVVPIDQEKVDHFVKTYNKFGGAGERVIGFAMKFLDEDSNYECAQTAEDVPDTMMVGGVPLDATGEPIDPSKPGYYAIGTQQFADWGGADNVNGCMTGSPPPATPAADALDFVGLISLIDPPREAVPPSVLLCRKAGVKVVMVTGDHPLTAAAIARMVNIIQPTAETAQMYADRNGVDLETGIRMAADEYQKLDPNLDENRHMRYTKTVIEAKVIPGWELKTMTPDQVKEAFMYRDLVFARTSPEQKLKIVNAAQDMGHVVAVTGDGVNDSPALRGADIGCAMGIAGTDVSKEAADMILMTDDFSAIVDGIEEGRLIFDNLKKSIAYTLSSNIPEISPFLMFIITQMPLSLTTVLILCVDLGTDMVPAISLAYEKAESDIMERPPRDQVVDHLVTVKLVSFAYLQIGVFQALAGFYSFFVVMNDYGFKMATIFGNADALMSFPSDMQASVKIHKNCPCGGGEKYSKYVSSPGWILSYCTGSKCNGNTGDYYPAITSAGELDTTSDAYGELLDKYGGDSSLIDAACPSSDFGVGFNKEDWGGESDDALGGRWAPSNWPYGWACPYGALKPTLSCKYPDMEFMGQNPCYKGTEALGHAQTAAFVSIVIVQWADLVICKTRKLSIYHQGMENTVMLFGLCTETALCAALAYVQPLHTGLGTRDIQFFHWTPSMPFSILIFLYDETRKYIIRQHNRKYKGTPNEEGWLEKFTYY